MDDDKRWVRVQARGTKEAPLRKALPLERPLLILAMIVGCLSIWTVSPLIWLWIGSQMESGGPPSMGAIIVVVVGVALTTTAIAKGIAIVNGRYKSLLGARQTVRFTLPWLRSTSGQRTGDRGRDVELSVLDVILILSVFAVLLAYNYWFLFVSDSPIDFRTGRE